MEILLVAADRRQAKGIKYGIFCIVIRGVGANFRFVMCWKKSVSLLREALKKKLRDYLGIFPKRRTTCQ